MTLEQKERMAYLLVILNEACRIYYVNTDEDPIMSDREYDKLLKELFKLEEETGVCLSNSPTKRVGYEPSYQDKCPHKKPILSLKDTKSIDELLYFLGENEGILSWKLDGVSIVLYYSNGYLINALTRGDGIIGKVIFDNVLRIKGVPKTIPFKGELIVRGEGCISLKEFEHIKRTKDGECFSNPRNLAAGIINTTKSSNILLRHVNFISHSIVDVDGKARRLKRRSDQFAYLETLGFCVVPHSTVLNFELKIKIEKYTKEVANFEFPVDGLVLSLNDIQYGESLGETAKYPKHSMAFKWPDEHRLTKVTGMKWSVSSTGLITPVVIFEPVELEGTIVRQANLHNLKFFEGLDIGKGDILKVYKANKIIPEVEENMTRSGTEQYPRVCPICGADTNVITTEKTKKLYCGNCDGRKEI